MLQVALPLLFALACFLVYRSFADAARTSRGTQRYLVIGLMRSVLLAFGAAGLLIAASRIATLVAP
jgi:hypothetical protein